jgi:hypothetical protein
MSKDLIMDVSKEIFTIDKDKLCFRVNSSNLSKLSSHSSINAGNLQPLSEEEIHLKNLTSDYLAFRTKTTKKEYYAVNPTYCIIPPNGSQTLNFTFYNKQGMNLDPKGHKFKFQGFIIPESQKDKDAKDLIKDYIDKGEKVVGNEKKCGVKFIEDSEDSGALRSDISGKSGDEENLRFSDVMQPGSDLKIGGDNNKEKLEFLKREHNQLQEQVDNLKRNQELLIKRINNEKNQKSSEGFSNKFFYKVPAVNETKVPKNTKNALIGIFILSVLVGFYLVK